MTIYFGVDYHGQEQTSQLHDTLAQYGTVINVVTENPSLNNYVVISQRVAELTRKKSGSVGILMCGTGSGTSIVANKHKSVYAVCCFVPEDAVNAKLINNANVLCLSARVPIETNKKIINAFLTTQYQGRKPERLSAIRELEEKNYNQNN